jgi:hypothetical protein
MTGEERDGVLTLLHDAMEEQIEAPPLQPAWPHIERGLRRSRRRRRARAAGKAGAGLLAVAALVAGVQTNQLPYPAWATMPMPAAGGSSSLADGPTRGSLAGDAAWLEGLRQAVADGEVKREPGGEAWAPPPASGVDVIYAGDVGGYRLALVEGEWRWGVISAPQQVWLVGRPDAAPGDMVEDMNTTPEDVAVIVTHPGTRAAGAPLVEGQAAAVVVSRDPLDVRLRHPADYGADGTVRQRTTRVPRTGDGAYEALVVQPGTFELVVPGRDYDERLVAFTLPDPAHVSVAGALPPVHGDVVPPADELRAELQLALQSADLPDRGTPRRLMWAGEIDGDRYRVVGLAAPSGARVLVVLRHNFSGPNLATWVVSGAALPAGALERAPLAWPVPADGDSDEPVASGRVAVLGPEGAATAVLLAGDREVGRATLTGGFAVAEAPAAESVRFLDAEGRAVGETRVAPLLDPAGTLAGTLVR